MKLAGDLEVSYVDGNFLLNKEHKDLTYIEANELKKFQNSISIIFETLEKIQVELDSGKQLEYHKPDDDWSTIFLENSQFVSNDELRKLWSELLKREITSEENGNKRTLDILKSLSSDEIKCLKELKNYVCCLQNFDFADKNAPAKNLGRPFLINTFTDDSTISKFSTLLNVFKMNQLSSIGIYDNHSSNLVYESAPPYENKPFHGCLSTNGEFLIITEQTVTIPHCYISNEGLDILNLIDEIKLNQAYINIVTESTGFVHIDKKALLVERKLVNFTK